MAVCAAPDDETATRHGCFSLLTLSRRERVRMPSCASYQPKLRHTGEGRYPKYYQYTAQAGQHHDLPASQCFFHDWIPAFAGIMV